MADPFITGALALAGATVGAVVPGVVDSVRAHRVERRERRERRAAATLIRDDVYSIQELITSDVLGRGLFRFGTTLELRSTNEHLQAIARTGRLADEKWLSVCGCLRDGRHHARTSLERRRRLQHDDLEREWLLELYHRTERARFALRAIDKIGDRAGERRDAVVCALSHSSPPGADVRA